MNLYVQIFENISITYIFRIVYLFHSFHIHFDFLFFFPFDGAVFLNVHQPFGHAGLVTFSIFVELDTL